MDDIDDLEDVLELIFSCRWWLLTSILTILLLFWLFLYLLSLRKQYSIKEKHVLVSGCSRAFTLESSSNKLVSVCPSRSLEEVVG